MDKDVWRRICNMLLLIFHLVLPSFTSDGVDITMARKDLKWSPIPTVYGPFMWVWMWPWQLVRCILPLRCQVTRPRHASTQASYFFTTPKLWIRKNNIETSITYHSGRLRLRTGEIWSHLYVSSFKLKVDTSGKTLSQYFALFVLILRYWGQISIWAEFCKMM